MKQLGFLLVTWALLFGNVADLYARGCRFVSCRPVCHVPVVHKAAIVEKVVVQKVVVTEFLAFPIYTPVASYVPYAAAPAVALNATVAIPPAQPVPLPAPQVALPVVPVAPLVPAVPAVPVAQGQDQLAALLARIDARLTRLEQRMGGNEVGPPPPGPGPMAQVPAKGFQAVQNSCGKCHGATAEKDGGNFTLVMPDGTAAPLTQRQADMAFKKVIKGEMPPKDRLAEEQGRAVLEYFDSYKPSK